MPVECLFEAATDAGEQFLQSGADLSRLFARAVGGGLEIARALIKPFADQLRAFQCRLGRLADIVRIVPE